MTAMKRKITINDIAKEAGVSRSLVSSVLTNIQKGKKFYRVSEETTAKIVEIMNRYDYHPNYLARTLRSGNTRTIGVLLSDISNRFFSILSRDIMNYAQQRGYMVMFANTDDNTENLANAIELFSSKGVQGFIVVPSEGSEETILHYKSQSLPIVLLDRDFPESGLSSVTLDNGKAAFILTEKLLESGHRKIEFVSYDTSVKIIHDRENGYLEAMRQHGLEGLSHIHRPEYCNSRQIEKLILDAVDRHVEALVFATYRMALLGRRATLKHEVTANCEFACFNNADTFDIYEKSMWYIKQPIDLFAKDSVDLLIDTLEGKEGDETIRKIVLPPQLKNTEY